MLKKEQKMKLLNFFIDHFIDMAKVSKRNRDYTNSIVFLNQAKNLSIILGNPFIG